jgi:hypothetical protein
VEDGKALPPGEDREEKLQGERIRAALASLGDTVRDLVDAIEAKKGERCPYRSATDVCTYRGGCVNRQRGPDKTWLCGGDHMLKWS